MKAISPAWKQALSTQQEYNEYRAELIIALYEGGIRTNEQIKEGLKKARACSSPFLPSVGQFVEWCKPGPEETGIPTPEQAYIDAAHQRWTHPIVYLAAKKVGVYDVKTKPARFMRRIYVNAYTPLMQSAIAGHNFEMITKTPRLGRQVKAIPPAISKEAGNDARLEALRMLGIRRTKTDASSQVG